MNAVNVRRIIFRSNHGDIWRAYSMSSCFRCSGESFPACPRFSTCHSPVRPEGHGLSTDSSFRFERGIDPNGTIYALKEAALLVQELAGGTISSEIKDNYPAPIADFTVELNYEKVHSLIGKTIPVETIKSIVTSLEMKIVNETPGGLTLQVPPYRVDVQRDCDVVEDILRIYGYNNVEIPTTLKSSLTTKGEVDYSQKLQNLISEQLVGCGFNEILNNSLTAASYYEGLETYKNENLVYLMNPLSNDLNVMRQTLLFGGLESIQHNANRKNADLKFFEFGNCYFYNAEKKNPEKVLAAYRPDRRDTVQPGMCLHSEQIPLSHPK